MTVRERHELSVELGSGERGKMTPEWSMTLQHLGDDLTVKIALDSLIAHTIIDVEEFGATFAWTAEEVTNRMIWPTGASSGASADGIGDGSLPCLGSDHNTLTLIPHDVCALRFSLEL